MTDAGHNSGIDAEREKLFYYHRRKYVKALAAKKEADAAMKNCGKAIKADLGEFGLDEIKDYETAQTAEGQEKLKAKSEGILRALRLAGMPVGTQLDIFTDRAPIDERAYQAGREAGMRGDSLSNPYNEGSAEGQAFAKGWHEGQEAIFAIEQLKAADAELIKGEGAEEGDEPELPVEKPKRGRPKKAKAGDDVGIAPATAANQNGASDEELTNAQREQLRQARAAFVN